MGERDARREERPISHLAGRTLAQFSRSHERPRTKQKRCSEAETMQRPTAKRPKDVVVERRQGPSRVVGAGIEEDGHLVQNKTAEEASEPRNTAVELKALDLHQLCHLAQGQRHHPMALPRGNAIIPWRHPILADEAEGVLTMSE